MHVQTGDVLDLRQLSYLSVDRQAEYVEIHGTPEQVRSVSAAVKAQHRAANKRARQSRRVNRSR